MHTVLQTLEDLLHLRGYRWSNVNQPWPVDEKGLKGVLQLTMVNCRASMGWLKDYGKPGTAMDVEVRAHFESLVEGSGNIGA